MTQIFGWFLLYQSHKLSLIKQIDHCGVLDLFSYYFPCIYPLCALNRHTHKLNVSIHGVQITISECVHQKSELRITRAFTPQSSHGSLYEIDVEPKWDQKPKENIHETWMWYKWFFFLWICGIVRRQADLSYYLIQRFMEMINRVHFCGTKQTVCLLRKLILRLKHKYRNSREPVSLKKRGQHWLWSKTRRSKDSPTHWQREWKNVIKNFFGETMRKVYMSVWTPFTSIHLILIALRQPESVCRVNYQRICRKGRFCIKSQTWMKMLPKNQTCSDN